VANTTPPLKESKVYDIRPTRNQFGANNTRDTETFSDQFVEDRTKVHEYNNDFDEYNTGNYTVSVNAAGTVTPIAGDGGIVQFATVGAAAGNFTVLQNVRADYSEQLGFRIFQEWLFSIGAATANVIAGLLNTTATAFTGASQTDGVYLLITAGVLTVNVAVGGVITSVNTGAVLNPGLANQITFKAYWDGGIYNAAPAGRIVWELSGAGIVSAVRGSIPAPVNFPGATLVNPTIGVSNSTAANNLMNVDLFSIIKDRQNPNATPVF
jgi:hypothetical protein